MAAVDRTFSGSQAVARVDRDLRDFTGCTGVYCMASPNPGGSRSPNVRPCPLFRLGWTEEELEARPKSDPAKLCIAARLRKVQLYRSKRLLGLCIWAHPRVPTPICIKGCSGLGATIRNRSNVGYDPD